VIENNQTKSGRGGKREGAGRKPGSATKKTREIADRAATEGVMPLEVMLNAMRTLYSEGDLLGAASVARYAAPYCHARLSTIEHTGKAGNELTQTYGVLRVSPPMTEAEWEASYSVK
jgi:hypothetical protein